MKHSYISLAITFSLFCCHLSAQTSSFKIVPLGTEGGLNESNLSAYMIAPTASDNYICFDAGTLYAGMEKAIEHHTFQGTASSVIKQRIKAYCISHPHLDHVAGLIINAPADTIKNIYATSFCINRIQQHYFTWQTWANFGDAGEAPVLHKYHYKQLNEEETPVEHTDLYVKALTLSHSAPFESTAFIARKDSSYILYFGDTGADTIEHSHRLQSIWQTITPLIIKKQVKGIFIEVSYPNEQPDKLLFGHLTPKLLMQEMNNLAKLTGDEAMKHLPVIITHIKPEGNNEMMIKQQLKALNKLQLQLIFPQQGTMFWL